jgi:hypothetical protein
MALDLDSVSDELYSLPPGEFTSTRDLRAAEARRAGDRELAASIKGLKRPTASAWLVNQLVRKHPGDVSDLLELGAAMRQAQEQLAGDQLRQLSLQRRRAISELVRAAGALARASKQPLGAQPERELQATLEAGVADAGAAEAVRSGRLTAALAPGGLGSAEAPPVAQSPPGKSAPQAPAKGPGPAGRRRSPAAADDSGRREAAELAVREAERAVADARAEVGRLARRLTQSQTEHAQARQAVSDLQARLQQLRTEETAAAAQVRAAKRAHETAARSAAAAERRADQARLALAVLVSP